MSSSITVGELYEQVRDGRIISDTRNKNPHDAAQELVLLDAAEQLKKINKKANQILDSTDPSSPEIVLKAMAEIRGQLKLQLEIFQALYNVEEVAKWQNEVMDIIGEVAPDARDRFYQRMHERRPL